MPYAYSTYIIGFPQSQEDIRSINQTLNRTYGKDGWVLINVAVSPDQTALVYAFQKEYGVQNVAAPMIAGGAMAGIGSAVGLSPVMAPPSDPLGDPDLLGATDALLQSEKPKAKRTTRAKKSKKKSGN